MVFFNQIINGGFEATDDTYPSPLPLSWTLTGAASLFHLDAMPFGSGVWCALLGSEDDTISQVLTLNAGYDSEVPGYFLRASFDAMHFVSDATQDTATLLVEFTSASGGSTLYNATYALASGRNYRLALTCDAETYYAIETPIGLRFDLDAGSNILIDNVRLEEVYNEELY